MTSGWAAREDLRMTPDELDKLIAGNVRAARARHRMRQEDLADELDWTRSVVGSLENGTRRVTLADAVALCGALKMNLRELLQGAPEDSQDTRSRLSASVPRRRHDPPSDRLLAEDRAPRPLERLEAAVLRRQGLRLLREDFSRLAVAPVGGGALEQCAGRIVG
ncbi:XRE family transcriptional regulator [Kribbella turkmenica]|uniref:XRE family transcriptional regulator n=1 Tax=Kribbella turkmenica TaxID=2530375 RepID=A0A4R4WGH6_9ACTN|nr:XRE family transcriptional regulator [Kribbella turkmenica]